MQDELYRPRILLLSGQIASGKSTVARELATIAGARVIEARSALREILGGRDWDRKRFQQEGARLDKRTGGRWLLHYLEEKTDAGGRWILDSARTRRQTEPVLEWAADSSLAFLRATEITRRARYELSRKYDLLKRLTSYGAAMAHQTEKDVLALESMASMIVETDNRTASAVCLEISTELGWTGKD